MDTVILAAGENRRLWTKVEPFGKPLVDIGGRPLLEHLVQLARDASKRIVVVASVNNVTSIRDLVGRDDDVRIVIQPDPIGPGDALLRGLEACDESQVMVLCGDNVMDEHDVEAMMKHASLGFSVGVRWVKEEKEALRFTRVTKTGRFVEGPVDDCPRDDGWMVWLGPLVVPRKEFIKILSRARGEFEHFRIGVHLNELMKQFTCRMVNVDVKDIGTPADLDAAVGNVNDL